ncbi:MAG: hypothetical protein D6724_04690 [Armatimonadetes bacterium]|nr:MAG: hypothetical protein D6724_04690 [Armatimonadota bacterium]GIV03516.1 MAG: hypothetical protein KatS3mg015_2346 [Fimbriimonadales bacterium]
MTTLLLSVVLLQGSAASIPQDRSFFAASERIGYTGTISVYNTLKDAQEGRNPRHANIPVPQRDLVIYTVLNRPSFYDNFNSILTLWYPNEGRNPNNKNEGFVQMYDSNANNWKNHVGFWQKDLDTFVLQVKGENASYPLGEAAGDFARLWNAGVPPTSGEGTKGTFLVYEYRLVATGLAAEDKDKDGFYENTKNATNYSGYFKGIFRNESERHPESNGYYVFNLTFNNVSWAVQNGFAKDDRFGSKTVQ